jgi:hypothetical protein
VAGVRPSLANRGPKGGRDVYIGIGTLLIIILLIILLT